MEHGIQGLDVVLAYYYGYVYYEVALNIYPLTTALLVGWFLLVASIIGFYRLTRWEKSIRQAANPPAPRSTEQTQQDLEARRNIERVFGIYEAEQQPEPPTPNTAQLNEAEARLQRDLREAGLL